MEQPSTAGDGIAVANNLSAAFEDGTVYSVVQNRLSMTYFTLFMFLSRVLMSTFVYSVSAPEILLVYTALYKLSFIIIIVIIII